MAIKTERVTIGAAQYEITQLDADFGRGLYKKFVSAIAPLLRDLLSSSGSVLPEIQKVVAEAGVGEGAQEKILAVAVQVMAPMILSGIAMIPDPLFEELCVAFKSSCKVGTGKASSGQTVFLPLADQFGQHFAGDYVSMTAWLGHCVRINGFLGLLGSGSAAQTATAAAA